MMDCWAIKHVLKEASKLSFPNLVDSVRWTTADS